MSVCLPYGCPRTPRLSLLLSWLYTNIRPSRSREVRLFCALVRHGLVLECHQWLLGAVDGGWMTEVQINNNLTSEVIEVKTRKVKARIQEMKVGIDKGKDSWGQSQDSWTQGQKSWSQRIHEVRVRIHRVKVRNHEVRGFMRSRSGFMGSSSEFMQSEDSWDEGQDLQALDSVWQDRISE